MNQGIFGLPGGPVQGIRKVTSQLRSGFVGAQSGFGNVVAANGTNFLNVGITAGVRTRILSASGRGAMRFGALNNSTGAAATTCTLELWIDGVKVVENIATGSIYQPSTYLHYAGGSFGGTTPAVTQDWMPFDSSVDVWVTTTSGGTHNHAYLIDLHQ